MTGPLRSSLMDGRPSGPGCGAPTMPTGGPSYQGRLIVVVIIFVVVVIVVVEIIESSSSSRQSSSSVVLVVVVVVIIVDRPRGRSSSSSSSSSRSISSPSDLSSSSRFVRIVDVRMGEVFVGDLGDGLADGCLRIDSAYSLSGRLAAFLVLVGVLVAAVAVAIALNIGCSPARMHRHLATATPRTRTCPHACRACPGARRTQLCVGRLTSNQRDHRAAGMPRPPQSGHVVENASIRPVPNFFRVSCTSPSDVTSET